MVDNYKTYAGDPWHADEDDDCIRIFEGNFQIAKIAKRDTPFEEYWPDSDTLAWMLRVLNLAYHAGHTSKVKQAYRIRHVPSGLYYCPTRQVRIQVPDGTPEQQQGMSVASNLSTDGKVYLRKPSLSYVGTYYSSHLVTSVKQFAHSWPLCYRLPVQEDEWQIEQVT